MMGPLRWLEERLGLIEIKRIIFDRKMPDRLTWWHTLGSAALTVFVVLAVTGVVLATTYSASPDHAYQSVRYTEGTVLGGRILRGMHHWAASLMVILVAAHMIRVFVTGSYKYPREANWLVGVGLFFVVMAFSFTGYLLPWDQKAYWATQVGIGMAGTTPLVGPFVASVLRGGTQLGVGTLSRFFAFHVLWLPAGILGLMLLHLGIVIRQGIAPRTADLEVDPPASTADPAYREYYDAAYAASKSEGKPFWPDIIAKDVLVSLAVVSLIVILAVTLGAPLEAPADPSDSSYVPRPEWYFLPLYQLLKLVPGAAESLVAVGLPLGLITLLILLPLMDRSSRRSFKSRPLAMSSLFVILGGSAYLISAANADAPPVVSVELGRPLTSMERAGAVLYKGQGCADCHTIDGEGGDEGPDLTEVGTKHSIAWLHSFVEEPGRFHEDSDMPSFGPPNLSHQEIEELTRYLSTKIGDADPTATPEYADTFPAPRGN
jgi:ubiquinol-cytochrome c reductase cytochrome b subunit